jgi:general secretion pathway protein B
MSFILDALRKSEHERQRQTGPALVEVAVAPPKPKTNAWATAAIALLLVNLVAIGVLLIWKARDEPAAAAAPAAAPASAPGTAPANDAAAPAASVPAPAAQASVTQTLPPPTPPTPVATSPVPRPAEAPPPAIAGNALEREVTSYAPPMEHEAAAAAATPPPGPAAVAPSRRGSVVYESLPETGPAATYGNAPPAGTSSLPRADEMTAGGGLPEMRLELHVYSNKPQERFVFVNGHRYREGDTTAEGAVVEEITRDGVVMNSRGNRFLLPRD